MRLRRIALTDVRGFGPRVEVELAADGVTVIEAPNEAGKSTLFDAVDVALRYKDASKHRDVKSLWPVDRDAPCTIEVELTCGEHHLVLTRTYRRNPATTLEVLAPRLATLSGDEAHDRLQEILDAEVDQTLYEALRFTQGRDLDALALGASDALTGALDRAAGGASSPEDGALWERVEREYGRWFTPTGRERDALTGPRAELDAAQHELDELERRAADLAADVEALAAIEDEVPALERERDERLEPELARMEAARREVDEAQGRVQSARARLTESLGALERAQHRQARRRERRAERDELVAEIAIHEQAVEPSRARLAELQERSTAAERSWKRAQEELARATRAREHAQVRLECRDSATELATLDSRLTRIAQLEEHLDATQDELAASRVDDAAVARLEEADRALQLARAQQRVGSPQVRIEPARALVVELDGERVEVGGSTAFEEAVASRFVLDDPTLGRIEVTPGDRADALADAVDVAERDRQQLLEDIGVADLADAQTRRDRRRTLVAELEQDRRERERLLEGTGLQAVETARREARARHEQLEARLGELDAADADAGHDADTDADDPAEPDRATLVAARDEAVEAERRLQRAVEAARGERDTAAAALAEQRTAVEVANAALTQRQARLDRLEAQLAELRDEEDDESLDAAVESAAETHRRHEEALEAAKRSLAALDPDLVAFEHDRLSRSLQGNAARLVDLGQRAAQLRGSLEVRGQDGLGEQLQVARDRAARARLAHERVQARAAAAALLHATFAEAREAAYRAYRAPFRDAIGALAHKLYGREVTLELDDELGVSHRTLDGITLRFEQLSAGAREQLAILTGLAAAQLAGAGGVPFVLDDALGYTDRTRLERLGALLGRVDGAQVIVLTCLADRFRHVGNAQTVPLQQRRRAAGDQPTLDTGS